MQTHRAGCGARYGAPPVWLSGGIAQIKHLPDALSRRATSAEEVPAALYKPVCGESSPLRQSRWKEPLKRRVYALQGPLTHEQPLSNHGEPGHLVTNKSLLVLFEYRWREPLLGPALTVG